jgi:hypothetical protein
MSVIVFPKDVRDCTVLLGVVFSALFVGPDELRPSLLFPFSLSSIPIAIHSFIFILFSYTCS